MSRQARVLLCVLALAVWFATTLGLMHRAVHLQGGGAASLSASASASACALAPTSIDASTSAATDTQAKKPHASSGVLSLFGDHTDAECRLYDQLSHGPAALCVPPLVLPVLLPAATFAYLEGEALARWVALFDARGPPSSR